MTLHRNGYAMLDQASQRVDLLLDGLAEGGGAGLGALDQLPDLLDRVRAHIP